MKIAVLHKKRGNVELQERFVGEDVPVLDGTPQEVEHHRSALTQAGYDVQVINWGDDIISRLRNSGVDLVFNVSGMVEAAILEELKIPYVGSDTVTIALAASKEAAKNAWQSQGLSTSPFKVVRSEADCEIFRDNPPFKFPLFVKPEAGRGSAGITENSLVRNHADLVEVTHAIYSTMNQGAMVERYLSGKEVTVGIVGNGDSARALPCIEVRLQEGETFLTYKIKDWDRPDDLNFLFPAELPGSQAAEIQELALKAYRAIGFRDYGRIDTIVTPEGPFLLEGNTFAGLTCTPIEKPHGYMGMAAQLDGMGGKELLGEIVQAAIRRYDLD